MTSSSGARSFLVLVVRAESILTCTGCFVRISGTRRVEQTLRRHEGGVQDTHPFSGRFSLFTPNLGVTGRSGYAGGVQDTHSFSDRFCDRLDPISGDRRPRCEPISTADDLRCQLLLLHAGVSSLLSITVISSIWPSCDRVERILTQCTQGQSLRRRRTPTRKAAKRLRREPSQGGKESPRAMCVRAGQTPAVCRRRAAA
jgi:hypothetical protein